MTSIVGIRCSDGVVIGTDSSATFGNARLHTIEQPTRKVFIVQNRVIVAGTGQIGLGQRFCHIVDEAWTQKEFQKKPVVAARELCRRAIQDFGQTAVDKGQYGALVAFPSASVPQLCEFSVSDMQPELKDDDLWYCSMGSAQSITDPFLAFIRDVFWDDGPPTLSEGVFAATWTLDHAIQVNPGGVNGPLQIAVLEDSGGMCQARLLSEEDFEEHRQQIADAKRALRRLRDVDKASIPDLPTS